MQGVFVPSQVAAAAVLLSSNSNLHSVLCQFFREDLISWTSRKGKGAGGGSMQLPNETLKGLVGRNTQQVGDGVCRSAESSVAVLTACVLLNCPAAAQLGR